MSISRIILLLAFIGVMGFLWYPQLTRQPQQETNLQPQSNAPDYIAHDLKRIIYDEQGHPAHQIEASKMEYYAGKEQMLFTQPRVTLFNDSSLADWKLKALSGTLTGSELIVLENEVIASNLSEEDFIREITTEYIEVLIDKDIMQSDKSVQISGDKINIQGQGLLAHIKQKQVELSNHVQTIYSHENP